MITKLWVLFIAINYIKLAESICPNSCSGHGLCGVGNICTCYSGWDAGAPDCSQRRCPNGTAWVDKAYGTDLAHQQTECSNAGTCDRSSGLCKCFPGFTGNACQRSTCPNDCSGHGICSTIGDVSFYEGPDYDPLKQNIGDGRGQQYTNWDKDSIQLCQCDQGFFGPDCSLVMCPKGDDPMTINQYNRVIQFEIRATRDLRGTLGLTFQGETIYLPLPIATSAVCSELFSNKGKFGAVRCTITENGIRTQILRLEFLNWPVYPRDNNLFTNDGNPKTTEFFCDRSNSILEVFCVFKDVVSTNIREYAYCSNRGKCDFKTGSCTCFDGFGGPACSNVTYLYYSGSSGLPGLAVNVDSLNYSSTTLQLRNAKSKASDFYFIEAMAGLERVFYLRGDGVLGVQNLETIAGGHTIKAGGLYIQYGGCTIQDVGLNVISGLASPSVLMVQSKYSGLLDNTYSVMEVNSASSSSNDHNLIVGKNRGSTRFALRSDGTVFIYSGGLRVTGGVTVFNQGMMITGGVTILSNGLQVRTTGIRVTGGVTINSFGLRVVSGGVQVTGGHSIYSAGLRVHAGGVTISSSGMFIVGGQTIATNGLKITGGATVFTSGLNIVAGGATVQAGKVNIMSGGLEVTGGATVTTGGLRVVAGGLSVISGGLATTGGLSVNTGGAIISGGLQVQNSGLSITGGLTIHSGETNFFDDAHAYGTVSFYSEVTMQENTYFNKDVSVGSDISVGGSMSVVGPVLLQTVSVVNGGMTVNGLTNFLGVNTFQAEVIFEANVRIKGTLTLDNAIFYSDRRLKTDLQPIDNALEKVQQLRGVYFKWTHDAKKRVPSISNSEDSQVGLIAQDVRRVLPEVVQEDKNTLLSINYPLLIPLLVESIKDLYELIKELQEYVEKTKYPRNDILKTNNLRTNPALEEDTRNIATILKEWAQMKEHVKVMNDQILSLQNEVAMLKLKLQ